MVKLIAFFVLCLIVMAPPAIAATTDNRQTAISQSSKAHNKPDPVILLDRLFGRLHQAKSDKTAKIIEKTIWRLWARSGSVTADLLLQQAGRAMKNRQYAISIRLLNTLIELKPGFAEAWNRRATVYYLMHQYELSQQDITKTLELEPRHFGALTGRGMILRQQGDKKGALQAYRRALAIYPRLPAARRAVKILGSDVERKI